MDLDDQLAALAAGELDDDTAEALRARAASDPALARRIARHARLQELLEDWEAPPLSEAAAARLDAAVAAALDALGDEPLADRPTPTGPLAPTSEQPGTAAVPGSDDDDVTDLAAARARRDQREDGRRGLPAWLPGVAVAAALVAVVGTGILAGGGLVGGEDDADTLADAPALESDDAAGTSAGTEESAVDERAQDTADGEAAAVAPAEPPTVDLAEGELLALLDAPTAGGQDDAAVPEDGTAADDADLAAPSAACVTEALERDTAPADGRGVWLTTSGRYAGQDAVFVVVSTPTAQGERYDVLAYDPVDCSLLARDGEVR